MQSSYVLHISLRIVFSATFTQNFWIFCLHSSRLRPLPPSSLKLTLDPHRDVKILKFRHKMLKTYQKHFFKWFWCFLLPKWKIHFLEIWQFFRKFSIFFIRNQITAPPIKQSYSCSYWSRTEANKYWKIHQKHIFRWFWCISWPKSKIHFFWNLSKMFDKFQPK